jgi:hypothetical protein
MKKINTTIHSIRIWTADSQRIKRKFFLKDHVVFGSDKKADIRVADLQGLHARFDFSTQTLHHLESGEVQTIEPDSLFQLGTIVFHWKEIRWWNKNLQVSLLATAMGILVLGFSLFWGSHRQPVCSAFVLKVAQGNWTGSSSDANEKYILTDLQQLKTSFHDALKAKNWIKAQSEVNSIVQILSSVKADATCGMHETILGIELKLSEHMMVEHLQNSEPDLAAQEFNRFWNRDSSLQKEELKFERWQKKIRRAASKLYLDGYEIEEENFEKSSELMEKAQKICLAIHLDRECYRASRRPR